MDMDIDMDIYMDSTKKGSELGRLVPYDTKKVFCKKSTKGNKNLLELICTVGAKSLEQREKFRAVFKPFPSENQ
jgi:hypothetical protein